MTNLSISSLQDFEIIDISQPVTKSTAAFPGDTPFSKREMVSLNKGGGFNLTAMTMSPHVGTHADAPLHIEGEIDKQTEMAIGALELEPFIGEAYVIDVLSLMSDAKSDGQNITKESANNESVVGENAKTYRGPIELNMVQASLDNIGELPKRILFKTAGEIAYNKFEDEYAHFTCDLVDYLARRGAVLMGIDTPSVDHINSKDLPVHHKLLKHKFCWLENLDLTKVVQGRYFLSALPLKLLEMEASPVRAVLLKSKSELSGG